LGFRFRRATRVVKVWRLAGTRQSNDALRADL